MSAAKKHASKAANAAVRGTVAGVGGAVAGTGGVAAALWNGHQHRKAQSAAVAASAAEVEQKFLDGCRARNEARIKEITALEEKEMAGGRTVYKGNRDPRHPLPLRNYQTKVPVIAVTSRGRQHLRKAARMMVDNNPAIAKNKEWVREAKASDALYDDMKSRYGAILEAFSDPMWWRKLMVTAKLTEEKKRREHWKGDFCEGTHEVSYVHVPVLRGFNVARDGLRVRIVHRSGMTRKQWESALPVIEQTCAAAGLRSLGGITIRETEKADIVLRFNDRDPLADAVMPEPFYDEADFRSRIGVDADGDPAWLVWKQNSGIVIGGIPGSGKTASLLPQFAAMEGKVELWVLDGKGTMDLVPLEPICAVFDNSGTIESALVPLRRAEALRIFRAKAMAKALGTARGSNFWNISLEDRQRLGLKPILVVMDECQTWFDESSATTREEKAMCAEIKALARTIVQKGRSAGIVGVFTTQKPTVDSIPSIIRDNCALKISFKMAADTAAAVVLGERIPGMPWPVEIPREKLGRFVMDLEKVPRGKDPRILGQASYKTPEQIEEELKGKGPVNDQAELASKLLGEPLPPVFSDQPTVKAEEAGEPKRSTRTYGAPRAERADAPSSDAPPRRAARTEAPRAEDVLDVEEVPVDDAPPRRAPRADAPRTAAPSAGAEADKPDTGTKSTRKTKGLDF